MGKKNYINRSEQESKEGLPTSEVNAPAGRIQSNQQIADTMTATDTDAGKQSSLTIKEDNVPSQVVHTTKVAELLKSAKGLTSGGSGSGAAGAMRIGSYSGNDGNIIGDMSSTTQLEKSDRSPTRTGKKLDSTLKHINYLFNEQVKVSYDESKPLAENPEATQGYNGTYRNEHARTQKRTGFVPADLYYDRSVDEIHQDFVYPVMGQSINDPAPSSLKSYVSEGNMAGKYEDFILHRGNHAHSALNVTFSSDGHVKAFAFADLDMTPERQDAEVANVSALNAIIDANTAEIDRQNMDANAGDELSPKFSPLPRTIENPTATIGLLRDIEASTGSEIFMAYKKSTMAMSYQLNKAAKDGQRIKAPMFEMISGCMKDNFSDTTLVQSLSEENARDIFDTDLYKNGAASLIIAAYDSVTKYNTKGDLLLQPRGFRMHIQTADNSMNVLRVPKKFVEAVNTNEVFSTIDREYDPFLPVCISDKASLAHPYSFNDFISNNKPKSFNYKYTNNSNNTYITQVYHPLVKGLYDYFESMGSKYYNALKGSEKTTADMSVSIPCLHGTTSFSLWSLLLLAATPFIVKARLTALIDVFDYEENFGYPFSQLVSLKEANPMYSKNYICSDYNEPITVKQMIPAVAFKWVFPETYWINREYTNSAEYVLPWYHNQEQYEMVNGEYVLKQADGAVMSLPSLRSGSRFGFLDTIYGMSERDVRLCLDRQTVYPCYKKNKNTDVKVYKYGMTTDGQPVIKLDNADFTYSALMKTPRELGWVIPAPNGMLTQMITGFNSSVDYTTSRLAFNGEIEANAPGYFRIRYWQGVNSRDTIGILEQSNVNISRAMSLQQSFKTIICQRMVGEYREFTSRDFILSFASMFDATAANPAVVNDRALFKPFVINNVKSDSADDKQVSMQKYFWTRIQRLPFAVNPFDCAPQKKDAGKSDAVHTDPYDFIYIYGCAGFRASDYNEDSYNREKERLNLGMLFVEDPYFNESPLYRG